MRINGYPALGGQKIAGRRVSKHPSGPDHNIPDRRFVMAEDDFTIIERKGLIPPLGCHLVCLLCNQKIEPGENLCPTCKSLQAQAKQEVERGKDAFERNWEDMGKAIAGLKDLASEMRGLAKSIENGKVPGTRRLRHIARGVAEWGKWLDCSFPQIMGDAVSYGYMKHFLQTGVSPRTCSLQ